MSKPKWLREIKAQAGEKPVLLVEGNTDIRILSYFAEQVSPGWETGKAILAAKRKSQVIEAVRDHHPEWVGVVDRDEWSPAQLDERLQQSPRVKVLPRFCLENYFCVPEEMWSALSPNWKETLDNDPARLKDPILDLLPCWVAHGAMWRVIRNRRIALLHESGFPAELDREPVVDIAEIRRILKAWHEQLDPDQIIAEYQQELAATQKLTIDKQLEYVHGKKFFRQVIVPTLNRLFGQAAADTWLERFTQDDLGLNTPPDLDSFLKEILALFEAV